MKILHYENFFFYVKLFEKTEIILEDSKIFGNILLLLKIGANSMLEKL